jgi:FkbM family methyltransferase
MIKAVQDFLYSLGLIVKLVRPENNAWLQNLKIDTVIDIGANTGQFAQRIHEIIPTARICSFEPIKSCYAELSKNTSNLNIRTFNYALGDANEEVEINISQHTPSSSLLEMADLHKDVFAGTDYAKKENITVKRLDDIADQLGQLGKCLIKIDVQGFEDRVIKGGGETIKKADLVIIETSFQELYKGQLLFNGIYDLLYELGFEFKGNISQSLNPKDGSILYAESLFRNSRK